MSEARPEARGGVGGFTSEFSKMVDTTRTTTKTQGFITLRNVGHGRCLDPVGPKEAP